MYLALLLLFLDAHCKCKRLSANKKNEVNKMKDLKCILKKTISGEHRHNHSVPLFKKLHSLVILKFVIRYLQTNSRTAVVI